MSEKKEYLRRIMKSSPPFFFNTDTKMYYTKMYYTTTAKHQFGVGNKWVD